MTHKLILIDGNSIINRAFFGVPELTNSEGLHTNAIYGFLNILFRILSEENGDYLCVAFDVHEPTFRHKIYKEYKGTRKGMPDELREQVPVLKELLRAMGITILEKGGYEADDILGTLAKRGEKLGYDVTLVSGDRDLLQIATDNILIRIPKTKGGKTEIENYHTADVVAKYSLEPLQIIELKALMGDSSDNIPGVPKIGEKTATSLLLEYHDIENLEKHISEISKNSIRESLEQHFDMARLSKTLATIDINVDIDVDFEKCVIGDLYTKEAYAIVKRLGFKNMLSRFNTSITDSNNSGFESYKVVDDFTEATSVIDALTGCEHVVFQILSESIGVGKDKEDTIFGLAVATSESDVYFIPVGGMLSAQYIVGRFEDAVIKSSKTSYFTFDLKRQLSYVPGLCEYSIVENKMTDLLVASYLCNPLKGDYMIEDIANEYAGLLIKGAKEAFPKMSLKNAFCEREEDFARFACYEVYALYKAKDAILARLSEYGMAELFRNIEMPLVVSLHNIEREGIGLIPDELKMYGEELGRELTQLENTIHEAAGEEFNINSPSQLGTILFEKMGMPGGKKTKTGYSTAADVLEKLAPDHPFVADILRYRAIAKLKSTYAEGLIPFVDNDNRIRSTFNQTITATGRISSTDPNLQNIPVKMEQGRLIRKSFVPRDGYIFVDADYSQIELRIMAHLSKDEKLIDAFNNGDDIHAITASQVFGVPIDEVTPIQRRNAKAVNFGIIYGISSFGLGQDLNISRKDAKEYIDHYFETFPKVKEFLDRQVADARINGYVTTAYGRRRPLPEINSSNFMQRSFGERVAMNAPIQGTAADIMKMAMIAVDKRLRKDGYTARVILQVHDELMIESPIDEADDVMNLLVDEMQNASKLSVKLLVEGQKGLTWYDAK